MSTTKRPRTTIKRAATRSTASRSSAAAKTKRAAPRRTEPGQDGEEKQLQLQLKLIADVGLIGFPNAGKSTLISRISAARPKIANYPFTTLQPNLGVVTLGDDRSFVVADLPGLLKGAHEGHGLGHQFLRHIERTKVLVHLVDVSGASARDPVEDFDTILDELRLFSPAVAAKPQIVVANKMDAVDDPERVKALERHVKKRKLKFLKISGATGEGLDALLEAAWKAIAAHGFEIRLKPDTTLADTTLADTTPADTTREEEPGDLLGAERRAARVRRKS